jgi:branched-subunit amino acid aminotransferase/4-amino-4-deoxychorismate lyase
MVMPIDDRIISRSHGVFDNTNIRNFKFYQLKEHLERLEKSCEIMDIKLP